LFENFAKGLIGFFNLGNIIFINLGVFFGIVFGAIPGLTGILGIILLLPLTFKMPTSSALLFLTGIYCGGCYGGSISAILLGIPETNESIATVFDGYPMAKKGKAYKALNMALVASTIGGLISAFTLLFTTPVISKFAIKFGPPEYFALAVLGLSVIAGINKDSLCKGIVMGSIGCLISTVGLDLLSGIPRFVFGNINLIGGLEFFPILLGLFLIPKILNKILDKSYLEEHKTNIKMNLSDKLSISEIKRCMVTILKSSGIGISIGAIPGPGSAIAAFISYNEAKKSSKHPEEFGHGVLEGVAAPESANNGVTSASLIPLFTLGIPGSAIAAVLLGALTMHGLTPGPSIFRDQGAIIYVIMIGLVFINLFMFVQGKLLIKCFVRIMSVSQKLLLPILVLFSVIGAFSCRESLFDVMLMLVVGFVFYVLDKFKFPAAPVILGIILGPIAEVSLKQSLIMSEGSWSIFVTRPISLSIIVIMILILLKTPKTEKKLEK